MNLNARLEMAIALAEGVRRIEEVSADKVADRRRVTADLAVEHGFTPERAAEVADEVERTLSAFAEALHATANAARAVLNHADMLTEELTKNAHTE